MDPNNAAARSMALPDAANFNDPTIGQISPLKGAPDNGLSLQAEGGTLNPPTAMRLGLPRSVPGGDIFPHGDGKVHPATETKAPAGAVLPAVTISEQPSKQRTAPPLERYTTHEWANGAWVPTQGQG